MRFVPLAVCLIVLSACASATPAPDQSPVQSESEASLLARARTIHERAITIDTHDDIPFNFATPEVNPCGPLERKVDLPKMRAGGLDVAFFAVFVGQTPRTPENYEKARADAMTKFTAIHRMAEQLCPDQIEIAYTADDVVRINRSGKLVAAIGIENGYVIGKDLSLLKKYHELGARYITLAHGGHNDIADSATPRANEPAEEHDGISAFGEQVVAEMNRVGIMVDVSHISKDAMLDAVRLSKAPVIASHSSARAVNDNPRNMDDEQLRALKANGGVMQTVALGAFVRNPPAEKQAAIQTLREQFGITGGGGGGAAIQALPAERRADFQRRMAEIEEKWPGPTVRDFVDHIDHAVKLIGIDHVGISSDFDGGGGIPGWNTAAESLNVTVELVRRGYTDEQITKLWGGNLLRVWRDVERVSRELQRTAT
jgi:membrane dipeptidase